MRPTDQKLPSHRPSKTTPSPRPAGTTNSSSSPRSLPRPPLPFSPLSHRLLRRRRTRALVPPPPPPPPKPYCHCGLASTRGGMPQGDEEREARRAAKALRWRFRRRRRREVGQMEPHDDEEGNDTPGAGASEASPPAPAPSKEPLAADDPQAMLAKRVREMYAEHVAAKAAFAELIRSEPEGPVFTVESIFCDVDDGSAENHEARKAALLISQSIVSLSSFSGGKRIRVCSGVVIQWNDGTSIILTSATLVRSPSGDNCVVPDLMVKVLLPSGDISDGQISFLDFHHNIALVAVTSDLKLQEVVLLNDVIDRGDVLAIGRAYEGGRLMCSRGQIKNQGSNFDCSELLVSSCKITMAGVGGPLVNYSGHVLGINFFEENQTPFLSIAVVSRCLEHRQSFGKIIRPWLGFWCTSLQMVPLGALEPVYQKFPNVDNGLYISDVVGGSPADVAGLCVGDVLVKCGGEVLSSAAEFGVMLLDICKEHMEAHEREANEDCFGKKITVEVVIKQQRDGSTMVKTIAADLIKEFNYNRWPAPMPCYKVKQHIVGRY